jgi:hypothetical protein
VGRKPLAAQVEEKEQLCQDANPKECTNHQKLTSTDQTVEGGVTLFHFGACREGKVSTTSPALKAQHHLKVNVNSSPSSSGVNDQCSQGM